MNIGQQDQLFAAFKDLAEAAHKYYTELVKAGFEPDQAIQVICTWQATMFQNKEE